MSELTHPVRLEARLDERLSRWLWLVKWLLVIPHLIVLVFLWLAFWLFTLFAFFAILFTGRYPRSLFEFNVGVLRWTWRVGYYAYHGLGTDRYPPFRFAGAPEDAAQLDVEYPERLSQPMVLVKWLLVIPHLFVVGIFFGGGWGDRTDGGGGGLPALIVLLVVFAGIALLFTGRYPPGIFRFVVGMNRWGMRTIAYVTLMTDRYPPFRLDQGGEEPGRDEPGPEAGPGSGATVGTEPGAGDVSRP